MEKKQKFSIFSLEEESINQIAFVFGVLVSVWAFCAVMILLDGSSRDYIVLVILGVWIVIRILEKKTKWFRNYAKYAYMTLPFWATIVTVFSNDGKFAAATQVYFMWLILSVAYYDEKMVLLCSAITIISNAVAIIIFPEAMLQLDNLVIWFYIFTIYLMATVMAAIIAHRMRDLNEQTRQLRMYEDELVYLEQLEKKEEMHNEFVHNITHYFMAIGELAREEHCEQIVSLMEELNGNLTKNERIIYTRHRVVNAVLSEKMSEALDGDIEFDAYVEPGILFGKVTDGELAAMLGNLLDNAFTAAKKCEGEKRKITLRIFMEKDGNVCVVKIKNYFTEKPLFHKNSFISMKKESGVHGIGMKSVERIAESYGGYLQCVVKEDCFTAILIIPV